MKTKMMKMISLCMVLIATITGCSVEKNNEIKNDTLTIRLAGSDWGYPQPYTHSSRGPGAYNMNLIFDSLLEKDEQGLIPWLAETYVISEDGLTYTFKLREDVLFSDGEFLTSEDVAFSFNYYSDHQPVLKDLWIGDDFIIDSVTAIDTYTVDIKIKEANVTALEKIGFTRILPEHIWKDVLDPSSFTSSEAFIGTGPYLLDGYDSSQGSYRFTKNINFFGPEVAVDVIEQIPVSDATLSFENGEIDYAVIPTLNIEKYKEDPQYTVLTDPPFNGPRLLFNMTLDGLKETRVRQAIAYAIDNHDIIEKIEKGSAVPGSAGYIPRTSNYANTKIIQYDFSLLKAQELLAGEEYHFELKTVETNVGIAELIRNSLSEVGITVDIKVYDMKSVDNAVLHGDYELILQSVGGYGNDPDYLREIFSTKKSSASVSAAVLFGYTNARLDELGHMQMIEYDEEKRTLLLDEMQDIISLEVPIYTLYNRTAHGVYTTAKFDGWMYMYDHQWPYHSKLSYLIRSND